MIRIITKTLSMTIMLFYFVNIANAQQPYTVLAPLPNTTSCGQNGGTNCTTSLAQYIPGAFNLAIGISAVLAFVMITFGGIMYATSDAITGKSQGREYATNAVYGLILVLGAYAILYTINPDTLTFNFNLSTPTSPAGSPTPIVITPRQCCTYSSVATPSGRLIRVLDGYVMTPSQIESDRANRAALSGVSVNNPACTTGATRGCTNMNDLPQSVINGLNGLAARNACGCSILVTGGTEGGHEDHRPGASVVDIFPTTELNRYLGAPANPPDRATATASLPNGRRMIFTYEVVGGNGSGTSTGNHWHVVIQ